MKNESDSPAKDESTYVKKPMSDLRQLHRRSIVVVAVSLILTVFSWQYFTSPLIPVLIFVALMCVALWTLRKLQYHQCNGCGEPLQANPFEPNVPIIFTCERCKIIWETGWRHPANEHQL